MRHTNNDLSINIVAKGDCWQGWALNYIESLRKIPGVNLISFKNKNYPITSNKWFRDYIFDPIYVSRIQNKDDITHFLETYQGHFIPFLRYKGRTIITCQDIYHTVIDDFKGRKRFFYDISIIGMTKADKIITGSNYVKNDLIKHLKIPDDKIRVIPFGVDIDKFKHLDSKLDTKWNIKDCKKIKLVMNVGFRGNEDRKNISGLLKAFYKLKKSMPEVKLIQVGADENKFGQLIYDLGLQKDVIFTGVVSEKQLILLYNMADLFVFPSFFEGFGIPPLEAMACGCPVITSNVSSLPEIVGDSAIKINPNDIDDIAKNMINVLSNEEMSKHMIKKGLKRVKNFTWERTIKETSDLYREIDK